MKQFQSLRVENLGYRSALKELTLVLPQGRLTGLVGPNGAGKTTLLRCLAGDLAPDRGTVRLGEQRLGSLPVVQRARLLSYLPQATPIAFGFTVSELVGLSAHSPEALEAALECMELGAHRSRSLLTLSGGERQRAAIARALAQQAPAFLLDEPLAHLDPRYQSRLLEFLRASCTTGALVVMALHDLRLAGQWCDEVVVLKAGELVEQGEPRNVLTRECLNAVFGVDSGFVGVD